MSGAPRARADCNAFTRKLPVFHRSTECNFLLPLIPADWTWFATGFGTYEITAELNTGVIGSFTTALFSIDPDAAFTPIPLPAPLPLAVSALLMVADIGARKKTLYLSILLDFCS